MYIYFDINVINYVYCQYMVCLQKALHMRAVRTFKDDQGVVRKNGEEWLITMKHTDAHIPNVYEEVSLVP